VPTIPVVVAAVFCATLVRSALGFGEALIAVPLMAFVLPVATAAPVAVLVSITVALVVLIGDWRDVHVRSVGWLVAFTLLGIPFGLLALRMCPESIVKGVLGLVVAIFAVFALWRRRGARLTDDRFAWLFGLAAGVLGGAYGMNGPPLVVYGSMRRWPPQRFRASLQGYFLPASLVGMFGYWAAGLWTPRVNYYFAIALPAVLLAIPIGRAIAARLDPRRFALVVHAGLLASGVGLVLQAIVSWNG
jgi:uncharacterized protein